ncbi:class II aldolase/adducin family protein [Synechococcus sp. Nb3U1]|uniref:class II aldolase/adducin family protein n=1 Tax=Synechococcus sp. Nb3U1 TaxID=1914529 RepID=UPI001F374BC8|nr:class II aldolase/adducin family protein [Synechococcus sp. Nb3U1]MCF2972520.1 class II aldolase/adducin family protein [Synechococcus sp. Nb3U1]
MTSSVLSPSPTVQGLTEAELRRQLAACYRLIARFGMDDLVYTHISVRLPGPEDHFLINPFGLLFEEVTASNLVKIDTDGQIVEPSNWPINPAGFVIHSAIHSARPDICCVLHTHTTAGMAVAALPEGLLPISQFAMQFYGHLAYHDYEGLALDLAERERLIADLGSHHSLILRNHGLLTVGRTIPEAFVRMYYLEQSCRIQIAAQSTNSNLLIPPASVCEHTARQFERGGGPIGEREWQALIRKLDREDPSYQD